MPDEATRLRQAELEKRHRDLTKPEVQLGSTGESLRSIRGMEGITDEMLAERATFSLKDMKQTSVTFSATVDMRKMTPEELSGLVHAAMTELQSRPGDPSAENSKEK